MLGGGYRRAEVEVAVWKASAVCAEAGLGQDSDGISEPGLLNWRGFLQRGKIRWGAQQSPAAPLSF